MYCTYTDDVGQPTNRQPMIRWMWMMTTPNRILGKRLLTSMCMYVTSAGGTKLHVRIGSQQRIHTNNSCVWWNVYANGCLKFQYYTLLDRSLGCAARFVFSTIPYSNVAWSAMLRATALYPIHTTYRYKYMQICTALWCMVYFIFNPSITLHTVIPIVFDTIRSCVVSLCVCVCAYALYYIMLCATYVCNTYNSIERNNWRRDDKREVKKMWIRFVALVWPHSISLQWSRAIQKKNYKLRTLQVVLDFLYRWLCWWLASKCYFSLHQMNNF